MIGFSQLRISNFEKFSLLALFLLLPLSPVCLSQTITVRLINQRNGQPLHWANQVVYVPFSQDSDGLRKGLAKQVAVETDAAGEARFELPKPSAEVIQVTLVPSHDDYIEYCGCWSETTRTGDVLDKGIVVWKDTSVGSLGKLKAQPGEILFLVRPVSFPERLFILLFGWTQRD
jgi:hypothetical protein